MTYERFTGTYEAKSPVAHGSDEDFGMEQRLRTLEMLVRDDGEQYHEDIPIISGNALRGQLRDILADDLLTRLDIEVGDMLFHSLSGGGTLERGSGGSTLRRRDIQAIREHVPMLSLLGAAIGSQMIESKLNVGMLVPVAIETESYTDREASTSVFEHIDEVFYTRMDDIEGHTEETQQMRYVVEVLTPGTRFDHWMTLEGATDVERACLSHAFDLFSKNPHIGGMQSRGHGRVSFEYDPVLPDSEPYVSYIEDNEDEIRSFITDLDEELS